MWSDTFSNLLKAWEESARFVTTNKVLFFGELISSSRLPWNYVLVWIVFTTPTIVLVLIGIAIPMVFFDRVVSEISGPKVITKDFQSSFQATEHLIENDCKKIAFLSISKNLSISDKRIQGYLDALKKHNITFDNDLLQFYDINNSTNLFQSPLSIL
jgi:hypothetical protein